MKCIGAVALIVVSQLLISQPYLNQINNSTNGVPGAAIMVVDTNYLVAGASILDWRQMDLALFSPNGKLIRKKRFRYAFGFDYDSISGISNCSKCLTEKNGRYYFAQTNLLKSDSAYVLYQKLDSNLDTVLLKKHPEFQGTRPQIYALKFDTDSTFIATGLAYRNTGNRDKYDLWIAKLDTVFNVIWEKRFADNYPNLNGGYIGLDIEVDAYGSLMVSGDGAAGNNSTLQSEDWAFMARLDRITGQLYWLKDFQGPEGSKTMFALDQGDGTYRFAESRILSYFPNTFSPDSVQLRLGLIDTAGTVLWDTLIGPKYGQFYIQDFYTTPDGNYYVAGKGRIFPDKEMSVGYKFSSNGDSIWFRRYFYQEETDISTIWSFVPTPDSGYIHVGHWVDNNNTLLVGNYNWLLKTDKYGCEVSGCQVLGMSEEVLEEPSPAVYPNPSTGVFAIEIPEGTLNQHWRLRIYNLKGRLVLERSLQEGEVSTFDLSRQPDGLYLLQMQQNGKAIVSRRIFINR